MGLGGIRMKKVFTGARQLLPIASIAIQALAAMAFAVLTARWLGPNERGVIVVMVASGTILMLVGSLGTATVMRVRVARLPASTDSAFAAVRPLQLVHVATSTIVGTAILGVSGHRTPFTLLLFVIYCGLTLRAYWGREILHGIGKHHRAMLLEAAGVGLQIVLVLVLFAFDALTLRACMLAMSAGITLQVVSQAAVLASERSALSAGEVQDEVWNLGSLVRESLPALGAAIGQSVTLRGDRILLGMLGSAAAVGIYSGAASFVETLSLVSLAMSQQLFRQASVGQLAYLDRFRKLTLVSIAIGAVVLYFLSPSLIALLLGESYESARDLIPVLAVATLALGSYYLDMAVLNGLGSYGSVARWTAWATAVMTAACFALIPNFGGQGAAIASLLSYATMAVGVRIEVRRQLRS